MAHFRKTFLASFVFAILLIAIASPIFAQTYLPGGVYYGRNEYVVYYAGDLPLIFSAPHGGDLTPDEIPDRTYGTTVTDSKTMETALAIRDAVYEFTGGHYPHVIISRLKRTKLDPNREIGEAAQGNTWAEQAWYEYHGFIDIAKDSITAKYGKGLYIDIHGHGHSIKRLELGYLISASNLMLSDAQLNSPYYINMSSIRALAQETSVSFPELLRGSKSLGELMEKRYIPAVPSKSQPNPGSGNPYFSGGYSTRRHGSRDGGTINGIQIEAHYTGIRDNATNRKIFAQKFTSALDDYLQAHFHWQGIVTNVREQKIPLPGEFTLEQNYPNPFNAGTVILFSVSENCFARLNIYNLLGEQVATLTNEQVAPGRHEIHWDAGDLTSGIYFYRLEATSLKNGKSYTFRATKKLNYLR